MYGALRNEGEQAPVRLLHRMCAAKSVLYVPGCVLEPCVKDTCGAKLCLGHPALAQRTARNGNARLNGSVRKHQNEKDKSSQHRCPRRRDFLRGSARPPVVSCFQGIGSRGVLVLLLLGLPLTYSRLFGVRHHEPHLATPIGLRTRQIVERGVRP
jgi:hypothetical protein